jgi:hypothetical protein
MGGSLRCTRCDFPPSLYWKIPLTYAVPFRVASWGTLVNNRVRTIRMPS